MLSARGVHGSLAELSAWELDCHASLTTTPQVSRRLWLSAGTRQVPFLTPLSGTQRTRCQVGDMSTAKTNEHRGDDTNPHHLLPIAIACSMMLP